MPFSYTTWNGDGTLVKVFWPRPHSMQQKKKDKNATKLEYLCASETVRHLRDSAKVHTMLIPGHLA